MGKTIHTKTPPKRFAYKIEIDVGQTDSTVEKIIEWCRENLRGTVYWDAPIGAQVSRRFTTAVN